MHLKALLSCCSAVTLANLMVSSLLAIGAPAQKPNVIFVLFDDMGYGQPKCFREGSGGGKGKKAKKRGKVETAKHSEAGIANALDPDFD